MNDYHINIFYSVEDAAYIADIPDFEMCSAHGETPQEALKYVYLKQFLPKKGLKDLVKLKKRFLLTQECFNP